VEETTKPCFQNHHIMYWHCYLSCCKQWWFK